MRPQLRPGLQVLRRDLRTVQLGLDWPGVVVLADTPALRAVLAAVDGIRDTTAVILTAASDEHVDEPSAAEALDILVDCGAVVDLPHHQRGKASEPAWASDWLLAGPRRRGAGPCRGPRRARGRGLGQRSGRRRRTSPREPVRTPEAAPGCRRAGRRERPRAGSVLVRPGDGRRTPASVGLGARPGRSRRTVRRTGQLCVPALRRPFARRPRPVLADAPRFRVRAAPPASTRATHCSRPSWRRGRSRRSSVWASGLDAPDARPHARDPARPRRSRSRVRHHPHPTCGCGWPMWHDTMGA